MPQPNIVVDSGRVIGAYSWTEGLRLWRDYPRAVAVTALVAAKIKIRTMFKDGEFEDALTFADECKDKSILPEAARILVEQVKKTDPVDSIAYKYMLCIAFGQRKIAAKLRPMIEEHESCNLVIMRQICQLEMFEENPGFLDRPLLSLVPLQE